MVAKKKIYLGIDIGGTKVYGVLLNSDHEILGRSKRKTGKGTPKLVLEAVQEIASELLSTNNLKTSNLTAVGVGFPGPLDPWKGVVMDATNLTDWTEFPLASKLESLFEHPAYIDNDVNVGTLAEAVMGAGKGAANVVGIFLGTGVGGGLVFGGQLYHGTAGTAGEVGHMIIEHGGRPGPLGLRGSVEGLTSKTAILETIRATVLRGKSSELETQIKSGQPVGSSKLAKAWKKGDKPTIRAFDEAAEYLGSLIGSLINFLAPDVIVLGGGVVEAIPEAILPPARKVAEKISVPAAWKTCRIVAAELGDDAGAVGAALVAEQRSRASECE